MGCGSLGDGEIKQKGKRTHRNGQQGGDCRGKEGKRGLNGKGKKYNTIFYTKCYGKIIRKNMIKYTSVYWRTLQGI